MSWKLIVKSSAGSATFWKDIWTISRIESNPFLCQEIEKDIRRSVAHTFPYLVFTLLKKK